MDVPWLVVALLALGGLSILSYAVRALDLLGAVVSFFLGLEVTLLGGLGWLALMTVFPVLGVLATRIGHRRKEEQKVAEAAGGERGVGNVLGNGLAPALAALTLWGPLHELVPERAAALAFATALAAVTADTLASEIGVLAGRARRIMPPYTAVAVGANGAVSWLGQAAAAVGCLAIGLAAVPLIGLPWTLAWVPVLGGFAGCQIDSVLGATFERDATRDGPLTKQDVNFLAGALPALAVLVAGVLLR